MKIEEAAKLITFEGFYKAFIRKRKNNWDWETFKILNDEFERHFGKKRYKNWQSFNAVWNRKIRQGKIAPDFKWYFNS